MIWKDGYNMKQIYYSDNYNIIYNNETVIINGENIQEGIDDKSPEEYAYEKMRNTYKGKFSRQYENIIVLSGSGTSVGIGKGNKQGKTMKGLWHEVVKGITLPKIKEIADKIKFAEINEDDTDLEGFMSKAKLAQEFLNDKEIGKIIEKIEEIIRTECTLELDENSPHITFLRKLTARKMKYSRAKIFTLNYDLLFEQAATKGGYVIIDGFSFNYPRSFNGINFDYDIVKRNHNRYQDEENFMEKVIHLYKPHGSLDWEKDMEYIRKKDNSENPLMIYPSNNKFEHSYEQPYFEMMSRFQQELRTKNTLLLVIGFSFYDKHISTMIYEALDVNQSITVAIVSPDVENVNCFKKVKEKINLGNIYLINEKFKDFVKYYPMSDIYDYFSDDGDKNETV